MTARRHGRWGFAFAAIVAAALVLEACGGNPNEDVDADEFIRAAAPSALQGDDEAAPSADPDSGTDSDAGADSAEADADGAPPASASDDDELDVADDIVRRYLNDTYGYSLELICGPFCNANSSGIDRVGFFADTTQALINIAVRGVQPSATPDLAGLQEVWEAQTQANDSFTILSRQETTLASDGVTPALVIDWTIDRRATGGVQERWRSLIVQIGPIAYFINAGAVADAFADVEPVLRQSLDSFIGRPNPPSVPGAYTKWDFRFPYNVDSINGEVGTAAPTPSFDSGVFIQQSLNNQIELLLIWEAISEAIFDPDDALTEALTAGAGLQVDELERGDLTLENGVIGRFALATSTDGAGNTQEIGVFAWYCSDSGRSFVLQSFSSDDPRAQAQASLDGFRCAAP